MALWGAAQILSLYETVIILCLHHARDVDVLCKIRCSKLFMLKDYDYLSRKQIRNFQQNFSTIRIILDFSSSQCEKKSRIKSSTFNLYLEDDFFVVFGK